MATTNPSVKRPSLGLVVERFGPIILSAMTVLAIILFRHEIADHIRMNDLNMENLYAAVLGWASIQIGFAFAVYGFVIGKTQGFIAAARGTRAMNRFLRYVKRANIGGFALTTVSLPLAAVSPQPQSAQAPSFWIVTVWFSLFVWTFFAFLRIAYSFGHLSAVRDEQPFHGA